MATDTQPGEHGGIAGFFTDPEAFATLKEQVIVPLVEGQKPEEGLRVWVVGCASGEEAYSVAMLFLEQLDEAGKTIPLQVFASDIDEEALAVARLGMYPESITATVSSQRLVRFFRQHGARTYQVSNRLRQVMVFATHNLVTDPSFSRLDLILCRRLLGHFQPELQEKILALLHFALEENGCLMLGPTETAEGQTDLFEPISSPWRIYRRLRASRPATLAFPLAGAPERRRTGRPDRQAGAKPGLGEVLRHVLLEEYGPAAVLINRQGDILYFHGATPRFLEQPDGEPTRNVLTLAREGLSDKLQLAMHAALRERRRVVVGGVRMKRNTSVQNVIVTARPMPAATEEGLLLVTFQDEPATTPLSSEYGTPVETLVKQLEQELQATRLDLRSMIQDLGTSNAEMKTTNEDARTINEELQSANEELETSKEELQALNEELHETNNRLQDKVRELEKANNDLAHFLNSTDMPTIVLDPDCRIRRFTPAATKLFHLLPTDLGRPLGDISPRYSGSDLLEGVQRVLRDLTPEETEIRSRDNRWYTRRILPCRTSDNKVQGVVITFADTTGEKQTAANLQRLAQERLAEQEANNRILQEEIAQRRRVEEALRETGERIAAIVNTAPDGIITIDERGIVDSFNKAAERMFGYSAHEVIGHNVSMLMPAPYEANHDIYLAKYLQTDVKKVIGIGRELMARRKDGSTFPVALAISELRDERRRLFTGIVSNISERKALEREVLEIATAEQRRIGQDLHDSMGQELTGLNLMAQHLVERLAKAPVEQQVAQKIVAGVKRAFKDVRTLCKGLVPVEVDAEGLMAALKELASEITDLHRINCTFECPRPVPVTDNNTALQLYRIAQEAVTNSLKHAQASHIQIRLETETKGLILAIRDDGIGLPAHPPKAAGMGLKIMRYRAGLIDATLSVAPAERCGTQLTCMLFRRQ